MEFLRSKQNVMKFKDYPDEKRLLIIIRGITVFFIIALVGSGLTAFPVETELRILCNILGISTDVAPETYEGIKGFFATVYQALYVTNQNYPFLAYGYDWLAFAHIIIGVSFIGFYMKPVRNKWIIYYAMIACGAILPLAFICGPIRQIPIYWTLIDCSFGVFGFIPLYILHRYVKRLQALLNYPELKY